MAGVEVLVIFCLRDWQVCVAPSNHISRIKFSSNATVIVTRHEKVRKRMLWGATFLKYSKIEKYINNSGYLVLYTCCLNIVQFEYGTTALSSLSLPLLIQSSDDKLVEITFPVAPPSIKSCLKSYLMLTNNVNEWNICVFTSDAYITIFYVYIYFLFSLRLLKWLT